MAAVAATRGGHWLAVGAGPQDPSPDPAGDHGYVSVWRACSASRTLAYVPGPGAALPGAPSALVWLEAFAAPALAVACAGMCARTYLHCIVIFGYFLCFELSVGNSLAVAGTCPHKTGHVHGSSQTACTTKKRRCYCLIACEKGLHLPLVPSSDMSASAYGCAQTCSTVQVFWQGRAGAGALALGRVGTAGGLPSRCIAPQP